MMKRKTQTLSEASAALGAGPDPFKLTMQDVRSWSDEMLYIAPAGWNLSPAVMALVMAEQRRREAWRTPSAWSLLVSIVALAVAIISAMVSIGAF